MIEGMFKIEAIQKEIAAKLSGKILFARVAASAFELPEITEKSQFSHGR